MNKETPEQCCTIGACPFAYTDTSAYAQGMGCLPSPRDILIMRQLHGKTWACHSNPTKPCLGAIKYQQEVGLGCKVIDTVLVTDGDDWSPYITIGNNLNKEQMLSLMKMGMKMTHKWFTPNEYIEYRLGGYLFECGMPFDLNLFWQDRTDESWNTGWKEWEPPKSY